ncbi:hypothetical protein EVAR_41431_1 [Eumeta japonica]|uniref:Uncharacterized protein n=1 Tax=Eumeta variegata TaxID=151549 RepID=A0A4C1W423_EUMVA|nr:hypothetical protein EVAR_41431_1 [Eumeta japonica]
MQMMKTVAVAYDDIEYPIVQRIFLRCRIKSNNLLVPRPKQRIAENFSSILASALRCRGRDRRSTSPPRAVARVAGRGARARRASNRPAGKLRKRLYDLTFHNDLSSFSEIENDSDVRERGALLQLPRDWQFVLMRLFLTVVYARACCVCACVRGSKIGIPQKFREIGIKLEVPDIAYKINDLKSRRTNSISHDNAQGIRDVLEHGDRVPDVAA